jgi:acetyl esterase/lipase
MLHEAGEGWKVVRAQSEQLQAAGYTVVDLEWDAIGGAQIWKRLTVQIESAVNYVQANAAALHVDPGRIAMVGGSRGANLALFTSLDMNEARPGTIKAIVSLSADVDPIAQIERVVYAREHGERVDRTAEVKISETYGCKPHLRECPFPYIDEWDPFLKVSPNSPAVLLATSAMEESTAYWGDQQPMADALEADGVPAEVLFPSRRGHGFDFWGRIRTAALAFLGEHDVD